MIKHYEQLSAGLSVTENRTNHGYPARFHSQVELLYVLEGVVELSIEQHAVTLHPGDLCLIFPNVLHSITHQASHKYLLNADPSLLPELLNTLSANVPVQPVLRREDVPSIVPLLLARCVELKAENTQLLLAHIRSILCEILPLLTLSPRTEAISLPQQIVAAILAHFRENLSLDMLAQQLGYNKHHISHVIGNTFGCNFRTLLNSYRIQAAREMLLHSSKSISQITFDCGFQTQSAFNRAFLHTCGVTPSEFKSKK